MTSDLLGICISPERMIRDAIARIDKNEKGIVLVTDKDRRLLGTVTDGDIRRAILTGESIEAPVSKLLAKKAGSSYAEPVTAHLGMDRTELLQLMRERSVRQLPLLDEVGRVVDFITQDEFMPEEVLPLQAVIMAGGSGTRLRPLTEDVPKPMLPVGERPLMELTIEQLRQAGILRVNIATHYRPEKITSYFGSGEKFGIEIKYVSEDQPLGTAGALGLLENPEQPILVINGDILTSINFRAMYEYHREHNADLTLAVKKYEIQVPYGVIECEEQKVCRLREKPFLRFFVNAGIYLLEPSMHKYIPNGKRLDMTDLIDRLIEESRSVVSFPILEYWLDIGEHSDYMRAQEDFNNGRVSF